MLEEIKKSLEKLSANGDWAAWNFPSAGWQVGTKKYIESKDFINGYGGVGSTVNEQSTLALYGDIFYTAWYQFQRKSMNKEIEKANAEFIANSPKYIRYLLQKIEELS